MRKKLLQNTSGKKCDSKLLKRGTAVEIRGKLSFKNTTAQPFPNHSTVVSKKTLFVLLNQGVLLFFSIHTFCW